MSNKKFAFIFSALCLCIFFMADGLSAGFDGKGKAGFAMLDHSAESVNVHRIRRGDLGKDVTGRNVIIGIVDSGIDWSHPDFVNPDGSTRILYIWDQTESSGSPPSHLQPFHYGSEYHSGQIQNELDGITSGAVAGRDTWGHGTHVAGIAAGNGGPSGLYKGMAPEADLIIVKAGNTSFFQQDVINGIKYIFHKAEQFSPVRPAVVNLSVGGTHYGSHDGTSGYERQIDALLWERGRAVVAAAGNDAGRPIHFRGDLQSADDSLAVRFNIPGNQPGAEDYAVWDIWSQPISNLSLQVRTPSGLFLGPVFPESAVQTWHTDEGTVFIDHASGGIDSRNEDYQTIVRISDSANHGVISDNLAAGEWVLIFKGGGGWFNGWLYESTMNAVITENAADHTLLPEPANAKYVISVGAYITRDTWPSRDGSPWSPGELEIGQIASYSSPGMTRDFREKPEITAPGQYIVSSYSGSYPGDAYITPDGKHRVRSGTSMAAPHVAGVIALMFERNPQMTSAQIRSILINSAQKDAFIDEYDHEEGYNPRWGFGKLDAYEALRNVPTSVKENETRPESVNLHANYPNPFNSSTVIQYRIDKPVFARIAVYDIKGRLIRTLKAKEHFPGDYSVFWDGTDKNNKPSVSGVYIYKLEAGNITLSRKCLLLR